MATCSAEIHTARMHFIGVIGTRMQALVAKTTPYATTLKLEPGWDVAQPLSEKLESTRSQDATAGFTRFGPHRADLMFVIDERDASVTLSRGQSKLYVVLLAIALGQAITELGGETPVMLLDDPAAELDAETQAILIQLISDQSCQSLMSLPREHCQIADAKDISLFHVKRGDIRKMVRL